MVLYSHANLLKIEWNNKIISGFLIKLALTKELASKITPHEEIYPSKTEEFFTLFKQGAEQLTPIILGTLEDNFEHFLADLTSCSIPYQETVSIDQIDSFYFLPNPILQTGLNCLNKNKFIIIDGHHRFVALQMLHSAGFNPTALFWIVPFKQLSINSFIKLFHYNNTGKLFQYIEQHYSEKFQFPTNYQSSIQLFFQNTLYHSNEKITSDRLFYEKLVHAYEIIKNLNCVALYEKPLFSFQKLAKEFGQSHLLLTHDNISHELIIDLMNNHNLLPQYSTCFKPKPQPLPTVINLLHAKQVVEEKQSP